LGAPSYIQDALLPALAGAIPNVRIAAVALPPSLLRASAQEEGFELLILPGEPRHLPPSWHAELVGEVKKSAFASPALAHRLGRGPLESTALADVPWVSPVTRRDERSATTADDCPIPRAKRRVGHEVQTILLGLEVAAATNQLIFGPTIAARHHLRAGTLVELDVTGWDEREPLFFACHVDRVASKSRAAFASTLRATMRAIS
jgi:DNA-binding transcriptional LysR family regulator